MTDGPSDPSLSDAKQAVRDLQDSSSDAARDIDEASRSIKDFSRSISGALTRSVSDLVIKGDTAADALRGLGLAISQSVLNAAVTPIADAIGASIGTLATSAAQSLAGGGGAAAADGTASAVRRFAKGGVLGASTLMRTPGGLAIAGEAGPEAVLPLARGPDGRLGVSTMSGRAAPVSVVIQARDAESFRRSRGQISAELARLLDRARRNQ